MPVGALVVARQAVAGEIWLSSTERLKLGETVVLGPCLSTLRPEPPPRPPGADEAYDRQARLFGDVGQRLLGP